MARSAVSKPSWVMCSNTGAMYGSDSVSTANPIASVIGKPMANMLSCGTVMREFFAHVYWCSNINALWLFRLRDP